MLNLAWEIIQLPLYAIYQSGDRAAIAYDVAHCTVGDVLISLGCYGAAFFATGNLRWPAERPVFGGGVAIATGVAYTIFSEWLNVSVRGSWAYAPSMPTLYGVGVSPVLQWVAVPLAALFALLALERRAA